MPMFLLSMLYVGRDFAWFKSALAIERRLGANAIFGRLSFDPFRFAGWGFKGWIFSFDWINYDFFRYVGLVTTTS